MHLKMSPGKCRPSCLGLNVLTMKRWPCISFNQRKRIKNDWIVEETSMTLQWRHNEHDGVSNHKPYDCLLNRLFRCRSKKTSKLRVTGLCEENLPVTSEFPSQRASNAENVSIWWRHHEWLNSRRNFDEMTSVLLITQTQDIFPLADAV